MVNLRSASILLSATLIGLVSGQNDMATTTAQGPTDVNQEYEALGIDGSGTTNPSKCFWHIMAKFNEQIKLPVRMSYRAVGSGTGIKEFLGKDIKIDGEETDTYEAYNDFGAGDIPISKEDRQEWNDKGIDFVQLPFVLSAVTFFHSIPGVPSGERGLNLTACLLAQIFDAEIETWDHPDILDINPNLNVAKDYPIFVGRRVLGSSSTYSMTHYLHAQCPQTEENPKGWPESKTASKIEWHPSTYPCDGSGLMTNCIQDNEGAIGYIDAAHGHEALLTEIRISNAEGRFLTTIDAGETGIQQAAVDLTKVPDSADGDFSEVAFYNMPGATTWPISLVSYVYIRKDLSFIKNPARRTLLKAFATALFDPDYIGLCDRFGHIPVPTQIRELSLKGLEMVNTDAPETDTWIFEKETLPGWGQGDRVISSRRKNFGLYEADRLADDLSPLIDDMRALKLEVASMKAQGVYAANSAMFKGLGLVWSAGVLATAVLGFN